LSESPIIIDAIFDIGIHEQAYLPKPEKIDEIGERQEAINGDQAAEQRQADKARQQQPTAIIAI
jgi:hypothetical protein